MDEKKHAIDLQVIEAIYDTVHSGDDWGQVIELMQLSFDSAAAGFFEILSEDSRKYREAIYTFKGLDDAVLKTYDEYYSTINPFITTDDSLDYGIILSDDKLEKITNDQKVWRHSEHYEDWLKPQDLLHTMGFNLERQGEDTVHFTMLRSEKLGYYSEDEKKRLLNLFSHLERGINLKRKLNFLDLNNSINESALHKLGIGIITLDHQGKIIFINELAIKLSGKNCYRISNQKVLFNNAMTQASFLASLTRSIREGSTQYLSASDDLENTYTLTISGFSERRADFTAAICGATVFISCDACCGLLSPEVLMEHWSLTPSEAKLAVLLIEGVKIREAAQKSYISYETARHYSKSIYQKAGVNSQTALAAKVYQSIGLFLA